MKKVVLLAPMLFLFASANETGKIEWTKKTFFKKSWYEAFFHCANEGARLPTDEEALTLPQSENDVFTTGLNFIKARSYERKVICVKDTDELNRKKLILSDIIEIERACGYDANVEQAKVESFNKKSTGDKIKDVASNVAELTLRGAAVIAGTAMAASSGGMAGGDIVKLGFGSNNNEMRTTDRICKEAVKLGDEIERALVSTNQ